MCSVTEIMQFSKMIHHAGSFTGAWLGFPHPQRRGWEHSQVPLALLLGIRRTGECKTQDKYFLINIS